MKTLDNREKIHYLLVNWFGQPTNRFYPSTRLKRSFSRFSIGPVNRRCCSVKPIRKPVHVQVTNFNSKVVRNLNRSVILNLIRESGPISRVKISQLTNLNKSTVSNIVTGLLDEELLIEDFGKGGTVGRSPINLRLRTGKHIFGEIYFDSVTTKIAIVGIDGTMKHTADMETQASRPEQFAQLCLEKLGMIRRQFHFPPFTGIGVSVAGIVDPALSKVVFAPNLGWADLDLAKIIRD